MAVILGGIIGMGVFLMVKADDGRDFVQGLILTLTASGMLYFAS